MKSSTPTVMTDELPLRIEEDELAGGEQFRVESRAEIESLLQTLCTRRQLVVLYPDNGDDFVVSALLEVEGGRLILDMPPRESRTAVAAAQMLLCVSFSQRVKLQFEVNNLKQADWQSKPALSVALPDVVLRFQRRDFFRLAVPSGKPLICHIPIGRSDEVEVSLVDISLGGVGILGYAPGLRLTSGARYSNVRIELPGTGSVVANLEIRASFDVTLRNGIKSIRTGAQFVNLPGTAQAIIQRYITRIDRERIAREQGKAI
jgi:flagellar brake protein